MILARIAQHDGALKSYTTLLADRAMAKARQAEAELNRGLWRGPLHGVPIAVKDLCYTEARRPRPAWRSIRDFVPTEERTVVERLERAGRGHPRQAADDRGRVRDPPPDDADAAQSLERGVLDRRVVERVGRGDGGGPVLRLARLRYRRIDPLSLAAMTA